MIQIIILSAIYILGFVLSFIMQRTEIAADKEPYTFGNRLLVISLSLLSFFWVTIILINAWIKMIRLTGYWDREIKPEKIEEKLVTKKPVLN